MSVRLTPELHAVANSLLRPENHCLTESLRLLTENLRHAGLCLNCDYSKIFSVQRRRCCDMRKLARQHQTAVKTFIRCAGRTMTVRRRPSGSLQRFIRPKAMKNNALAVWRHNPQWLSYALVNKPSFKIMQWQAGPVPETRTETGTRNLAPAVIAALIFVRFPTKNNRALKSSRRHRFPGLSPGALEAEFQGQYNGK